MRSLRLSSLAALASAACLIGLLQLCTSVNADYPGVIELVGYSNRRARTHYMPPAGDNPTLAPPPAKIQADIETVKANIEKYNKLLTLDTKNLPESQKDMLERIVERVARLKESLDIDDSERLAASAKPIASDATPPAATDAEGSETLAAKTTGITTEASTQAEAETDPTLVLDETTLLHLQTSMDELAVAQAAVTAQTSIARDLPMPTTTEYNFNIAPGSDDDNAGGGGGVGSSSGVEPTDSGTDSSENEDTTESLLTAGGTAAADYPTTTVEPFTDATDADDQFVAARSNNNIPAASIRAESEESTSSNGGGNSGSGITTIGSQRTLTTSGKLTKTRATKRPGSGGITKTGIPKRGQKPGGTTAGVHRNKQKLATTTTQPLQAYQRPQPQYQQPQKQPQLQYQKPPQASPQLPLSATSPLYQASHKVSVPSSAATFATDKTSAAAAAAAAAASASASAASTAAVTSASGGYSSTPITTTLANNYGNVNNDMDYEPQVNTSALIDSLNNAREEFYLQKQGVSNKDKKPSATAKPTKYHYYPHNQHIYLLPECAIQQVCNAVYVRLNYTQPLCACPSRYRDPCSASLNEDDQHTTKLVGDSKKKAITLAKTCEATTEMRECNSPKDWSLLALQNIRTGKSHYLIICRCPDHFKMEGPMAHDQPKYASVPGIRVFGMMCVKPGYSVRKPSSQPPKRYQLQKPFYRPGTQSNSAYINVPQYGVKDTYGRPSSSSSLAATSNYHAENSFSNQHQSGGYQYLNRPDTSSSNINPHQSLSVGSYRPDTLSSINNFPSGIYGRNNERKGETPIEAVKDEDKSLHTSTQQSAETAAAGGGVGSGGIDETTSSSANLNGDDLAAAASQQLNEEVAQLRQKRAVGDGATHDWDNITPEFPWDRVMEFQQTIVWD
ncbi:PREDICTED: uncharacterized protein LOC108372967 isoform X2 [Rhagoletis zephyria]|uniref:uncharacterized protein LOC108372967 isoform X2 n=1 Tax=Rhagoletis zephyria TaxID=28612 RepID=UPI0008113B8F|nr:PREDICTED: uncharacterized protein LOC108372967 isoform X2 [Rhagoletis zephyria]